MDRKRLDCLHPVSGSMLLAESDGMLEESSHNQVVVYMSV